MCEFSRKLVAWLDRELPKAEATTVEWHVAECPECQEAMRAFEEVSGAFLECYERTASRAARRPRWIFAASGVAASAAAAIVGAILIWPRPAEQLPLPVLVAPHAPALAFVRHTTKQARSLSRPKPAPSAWTPAPPIVEVELPADMLFPPGAVPEGFSFIAEVRTEP